MYFKLKAVLRSLILPPAGPLLLACVALWMLWRGRRGGWSLLAVAIGLLWLLSTQIVADQLTRLAERYPALDPNKPVAAQAVVILGGGEERMLAPEYGGPVADVVLLERLAYGAFVAKRNSLPVLVSGSRDEGVAMSATLTRDFGMQARWVERHSQDTYENAHFTAQILLPEGIRRIVLVTSSTHLWRAAHEFLGVGFEVVPAPAGIVQERTLTVFSFVPTPAALARSNAAVYELLGEPVRRLQAALGVRERFDRAAALPTK